MNLPDDFTFSVLLPANLVSDVLKTFQVKKHLQFSLLLLLHCICHGLDQNFNMVTLKRSFNVDDIETVLPVSKWRCNLFSEFLKNRLGNDYDKAIQMLIDNGFICRSDHYWKSTPDKKGFSKAFWLKGKYARYFYKYKLSRFINRTQGTGHVYGYLKCIKIEDRVILKRMFRIQCEQKEIELATEDIGRYYDHLTHFSINAEHAENVLKSLNLPDMAGEMRKVERFNRLGFDPAARYVKRDHYGRVHTNVTSLKREVRDACMTCDGENVAGIDIKSSQASFLCRILHEWERVASDSVYFPTSNFVDIFRFWGKDENAEFSEGVSRELSLFEGILKDGHMYEFFAENMGPDVTRKRAKAAFLEMLFSRNNIPAQYQDRIAAKNVWAKWFPHLLRCIMFMKRNNHACLAHEMQRTESSFVFDVVIPRIELEIGCHYCTVHDSVIVPMKHVERVHSIMDEELCNVGIPTMTEVEFDIYNPPEHVVKREAIIDAEMERRADDEVAISA